MVQVLKEEVRQAILRVAGEEFARYGYGASSIKRIAQHAGISVGNLYHYYAGKEVLFDAVVAPAIHELERLMLHHEHQPQQTGPILEQVVHRLSDVITNFRRPLLILIDGSKGTRHENTVATLYKMMADNVFSHMQAYNEKQGREVFAEAAAWPVAVAFLQGYCEIVRRHAEAGESKSLVHQYVAFWYEGLRTFFTDKKR